MKQLQLNGANGVSQHAEKTRIIDDFLKEIRNYPVPTQEEENELIRKYHSTHDISIRNYLVCCHQRFVYSAAKRYTVDPELVMELVGEGNLGLIEAIEKFNPDNNNKLLTYAQCYIRRNMNYYLNRTKIVRRDSDSKIGTRLETERNLFFSNNGRMPTNDELRDIMKEKYEINYISDYDLEIPTFLSTDFVAPNCYCDEGEVSTFLDSPEFTSHTSCENGYVGAIENDDIKATILAALECLSEREKDIVKMLFGIDYPEDIDPDVIAEKYGITRTRVFQIRAEALKTMKYAVSA